MLWTTCPDAPGNKGRDEHDAVKAVQNAAVPREDRAVILDADLALDGRREQVDRKSVV